MAIFSLDIETTSLDHLRGSIISVSWCGTDLKPVSREWTNKTRYIIAEMVSNPKNTIITQNGVFDFCWLIKEGMVIKAKRQDTMIASHVIHSNKSAALDALVDRYLHQEVLDKAGIDVILDPDWKDGGPKAWIKENKKWFKQEYNRKPHYGDVPRTMLHEYAKKDSLYTLLVWFAMRDFLTDKAKWTYDLNMSMVPIVLGMNLRGIPINLELCRKRLKVLKAQQVKFLRKYNIDKVGPLALRDIIFPSLGIELKYKTEKGNWRFNERSMRRYQIEYPEHREELEQVIQYRKAKQSDSTYYTGFIYRSYRRKIYPVFNLTKAKTGRFSSSGPNLQNIKKKGDERAVFLVRPEHINIHWDFDQVELRILAHYSEETNLLDIFNRGIDPHTRTAELMEIDEKTAATYLIGKYRDQKPRFIGKQLNFSFWYGMGIDTFCLDLGIPRSKGETLYAKYRDAFPNAIAWSKRVINKAKIDGYVEDIFGRQYRPDDRWSYYKLINYLIQGTAAQIMKIAMFRAQRLLHKDSKNVNIVQEILPHTMHGMQLLTVHDEIGIEFLDNPETVHWAMKNITEALTIRDVFILPLTVSAKWTRTNWKELQEVSEVPITW